MSRSTSPAADRRELIEGLRRYTVGPIEDGEVIRERASDRYHTGFLAPAGTSISPEEDDVLPDDDSETGGSVGDSILALANVSRQSAMGLTFHVDPVDTELLVYVQWAEYDCSQSESAGAVWNRRAVGPVPLRIPAGQLDGKEPLLSQGGVSVRVLARERLGVRLVTVSVINERPENEDRSHDFNIYQVRLEVAGAEGERCFVSQPPARWALDEEFWGYELLYRNSHQFAVGHGCAVDWSEQQHGRTDRICSEWIPATEVFKASADVLSGISALSMDDLSNRESRESTCNGLLKIPQAYEDWLAQQTAQIPSLLDSFKQEHQQPVRSAAEANIRAATTAARRMREGVELLRDDDLVWKAFCAANEAIALSMRKSKPESSPRWRAFQVAFIVQCLASTVDAGHSDRALLDLIWFPTGGGKTEAYLGLALFAIFHRRLKYADEPCGTVVLTRYTLRLLTIQQFERAARSICASEIVRNRYLTELANEPITIGLYLGGSATPNSLEEAANILADPAGGEDGQTTCPLVRCPWCSTPMGPRDQSLEDGQLVTRCRNQECEFNSGLPIVVVDDQIYDQPPTFVIGTIDKFALLPWKPAAGALLGRGAGEARRPPTLIIQDELHLISESLGTIAALYETAIDYLCQRGGCVPKVIGSTATIRRAQEQTRRLFNRSVAQFPPSVLDVKDSFFYSEDRTAPGRMYVGVHAQGRSPKHTLARLMGTLAQLASQINDPKTRDVYHTLVCYFNSLRELGGAVVLAEDDVPRYIDAMPLPDGVPRRQLPYKLELTSVGLPQNEIPRALAQLETRISALEDDLDKVALDVVLATNMISVGVDVDRLGLMIVNGQPKTTSEYIQASSRVGRPRGSCGVVVVAYNWTRPRDRSHYERFIPYHQAFYRQVESSSVTPFAARARDRALHAVLFSLARISIPELRAKESAERILTPSLEEQVRTLMEVIAQRAVDVDPDEAAATRQHLEAILSTWKEGAEQAGLCWQFTRTKGGSTKRGVMRSSLSQKTTEGLFATGYSMRDVEPPSPVTLATQKFMKVVRQS